MTKKLEELQKKMQIVIVLTSTELTEVTEVTNDNECWSNRETEDEYPN